jgi:hypothetical protein
MNKKRIIIYLVCFASIFFILVWIKKFTFSEIRLNFIILIVLVYVYYSEMIAHKRVMSDWENIRKKGKTQFILLKYVLLRGCTVSVLIILLLTLQIRMSLWLVCPFIPLLGVFAYAGNEVWNQCEERYGITRMKSVAEKMKILQN